MFERSGLLQEQRECLPILGHHRDPGPQRLAGRAKVRRRSLEQHLAFVERVLAEHRARQLRPSGTDESREPDDLSATHRQTHVLQTRPATRRGTSRQSTHLEDDGSALAHDGSERIGRHRATDHQLHDLLERRRLGGHRCDVRSIAEHRDAVRDREHLRQPVRHEQNRGPLVAKPAHERMQPHRFVLRERCRRLVHHEQPRAGAERSSDLDELLLRETELANGDSRIDVEPHGIEHRSRARVHRATIEPHALRRHAPHADVLGDAQRRERRELLVDDGDAGRLRFGRRIEVDLTTVEEDSTFVALHRAGEDVDHRALARAVLTDERVNLAGVNVEMHSAERVHAAVAFVHVLRREQRRGHALDHFGLIRNFAAFSFVIISARVKSLPYWGTCPAAR